MDAIQIFRQVCPIAGMILFVVTVLSFLALLAYRICAVEKQKKDQPAVLGIDRSQLQIVQAPPEIRDALREHEELGTARRAVLYVLPADDNDPDDPNSHIVDALEIPIL